MKSAGNQKFYGNAEQQRLMIMTTSLVYFWYGMAIYIWDICHACRLLIKNLGKYIPIFVHEGELVSLDDRED